MDFVWKLYGNTYAVHVTSCNGRVSRCCHIESSFTGPPPEQWPLTVTLRSTGCCQKQGFLFQFCCMKRAREKGVHWFQRIWGGGYLVERWVGGYAAQKGLSLRPIRFTKCFFFYLKIDLDRPLIVVGRVFAKCLIFNDFFFFTWFYMQDDKEY